MTETFDIRETADELWWNQNARMYAILDGARDDVIHAQIVLSGVENACLYRGEEALDLAEVAPYLVLLEQDHPLTQWLLENGWGKSWGIFVDSEASLSELKRHFQKFIIVYDEEAKPLYFRYYDPRVLRLYLPTCNEEELETLFGPVNRFFLESEPGNSMISYGLKSGRLEQLQI